MTKNINLYKKLYQEKKYEELIYKIENLEKIKSAQLLHILGICKLSKKNISNNDKLSAREDFRKAFESEKNSNIGIEALTNFINVSTDFLLIDESLKYYAEIKDNFDGNIKLLKSVSRIYQFSLRTNERIKILEKIIDLYPSSIDDWCSYIYINNFKKKWNQIDYFENSKKFSQNIKIIDSKKIKIDNSIIKRKIKIAFFSSDINQAHSVTYFLKPVLKNINKNKFEIYVISNSIRDEYKDQYKKYLNDWFNIRNLNDLEAINFIREKKIDIIFDLMGFTSENRINLFKNRIAPIQISWLGYCNTLGLKEMDYIFADENLIFNDEEKYYTEKVIKLKNIWNTHIGFDFERAKLLTPATKNGYITFGSFNNFNKISDETIETWGSILKKISNSKLLLKSSTNLNIDVLIKKFEQIGIKKQIKFIPRTEKFDDHLNNYNEIDLALDTFPYNGVTTTFEAIWKGVPVLTIEGYNFNSRCGSSIIKNLGINYLVAKNEDDYISKAIYLSNNLDYLSEIRDNVFNDALNSPLFDTEKFGSDFENKINFLIKKELENN